MTKAFTILVNEAEEGGYWAECVGLDCGSLGKTLDEMDFNTREAVVRVRAEDGENIKAIKKAENVEAGEGIRKWEIAVHLPALAAA